MPPTIMLTAAEKEIDSVHCSPLNSSVSVPSSKPFVFPAFLFLFQYFESFGEYPARGNSTPVKQSDDYTFISASS